MYSVEELETALLAAFWNVRFARDRLPDGFVKDTCDITGMPVSANDIKPMYRAEGGDGLALSWTPVPGDLAASMIRYCVNPGSGQEAEYKDLNLKPRAQWTEEEVETHSVLTYRIKVAAHRLASHGWMNLQPPDFDEKPQAFGDDGMCARIQITPSGLEEAKKRVRGTRFEHWIRGWKEALPASEFAKTPEWYQAQKRHTGIDVS